MNNQDFYMCQMNQNLINNALYYMSEDTETTTRIVSNTEAIVLLGFTGFLVLLTIFAIWYSMKE